MKIFIVGASGNTGKLLVKQLLDKGHHVKAIVRSTASIPDTLKKNDNLILTNASVTEIPEKELTEHVKGCDAVASCLGHNITFKGIYGQPRKLVTDTARRLCEAIRSNNPKKPVRYVLMNTTGNRNRDLNEPISFAEKAVIGLIRLLLPPHVDNEQAADYLRTNIGQNDKEIEWVAVRPDGLIDGEKVTKYELHPSPIRSAIFNAGKVSRINVAHFMAELISDDKMWKKWKGQMPVIYNQSSSNKS